VAELALLGRPRRRRGESGWRFVRADHVSAAVEIEDRATHLRIRRAHPFGLHPARVDGFALDVGIDRERTRDLLEPRARLLHARIWLDHRLSPEHLNDRLKLLSRNAHCLL